MEARFDFTQELVDSSGNNLIDLSGREVQFHTEPSPGRVKISFWAPEDEDDTWYWNIPVTDEEPEKYKGERPDILYGIIPSEQLSILEKELDLQGPFSIYYMEVVK